MHGGARDARAEGNPAERTSVPSEAEAGGPVRTGARASGDANPFHGASLPAPGGGASPKPNYTCVPALAGGRCGAGPSPSAAAASRGPPLRPRGGGGPARGSRKDGPDGAQRGAQSVVTISAGFPI